MGAKWLPLDDTTGLEPVVHKQQLLLSNCFACLQLIMTLCFRFISPASAFYIDEHQSPPTREWSYEQQPMWSHQYKACSLKAQSPIDIQYKNVITNNHLKLNFYNYNRQMKFMLQNVHHTIKMNPIGLADQQQDNYNNNSSSIHDMITADEYVESARQNYHAAGQTNGPNEDEHHAKLMASSVGNNLNHQQEENNLHAGDNLHPVPPTNDIEDEQQNLPYEGAPTIKLDWLDDGNNEYKLRDIHFHWGERRDNGSEHAIDGRRAAMEMHLVHIKHGLDKSKIGFTSDSVAVIAILIESHRKSNADFNPIVNVLSRINMTEESHEIEYKSIKDLLPSNLNSFYTYSGSLTTPPCYQVVNWIIMTERLNMNAKQIEMFRNLYAPAGKHNNQDHQDDGMHRPRLIVPNIRTLQPLNNRTILASFSRWGRLDHSIYNTASSIHQNWWLQVAQLAIILTYINIIINRFVNYAPIMRK